MDVTRSPCHRVAPSLLRRAYADALGRGLDQHALPRRQQDSQPAPLGIAHLFRRVLGAIKRQKHRIAMTGDSAAQGAPGLRYAASRLDGVICNATVCSPTTRPPRRTHGQPTGSPGLIDS